MARLSDLIELMLKEAIQENEGSLVINRNDLAQKMNCVPSQITYVLTTRFTNQQGYLVESRRGGGGSITIQQVQKLDDSDAFLMHTINSLPERLSQHDVRIILNNLIDYSVIDEEMSLVMRAALSDRVLQRVEHSERDLLRQEILKNMLMQLTLI